MKKLISHFVKIVLVWIIGFFAFTTTLPETPTELPAPADAIVVLTGDSYRISAGFDLYKNFRGDKLFISGVFPGATVTDLARPYLSPGRMVGIELDHKATNTHENAIETALWVQKQKYKSIILVTSDYHMRRSRIHFQNHMPDVAIMPYAVTSSDEQWWQNIQSIKTMVRAYNKLIVTLPLIFINKFTA